MNLFIELKRRNVIKVGIAYVVAGWILAQGASIFLPSFGAPAWVMPVFLSLVIAGFPLALIFAWAFEMTPEGIKRTTPMPGKPDARSSVPGGAEGKGGATPSVAVLPFVNMSSDPEQEYFSDGLSEELLNQLAQNDRLKVIGRTSSFAFKGRNADLREIGEQLGAGNLLEGSVRKSGDRLRITAQLIDAVSGHHLWSATYDRQLVDVFAVQDEIARSVANALSVTLGIDQDLAEAGRTDDVQTYDLYLRARSQMHTFLPADFLRGADLFRQALLRDPDYSRARAGLVYAAFFTIVYVPERRAEAEKVLEQTAAEADARAPQDWATHLAHAASHMCRHEWADAEEAFLRAEAIAPAAVPELIELKSVLFLGVGRVEEALEFLLASMAADPMSAMRSFEVQFSLWMLGRNEESEAEFERSQDLPGVDAREDIHHTALFRALKEGDDAQLIEERFDRYLSRQTIPMEWARQVRAVYDDRDAALAVIRAAFADPANQDGSRAMFVAAYAGHYGDADLALAALRRSTVELKSPAINQLWWPPMAGARRLPGFKDIVRELGLVDYWQKTGRWSDFCHPLDNGDFECN